MSPEESARWRSFDCQLVQGRQLSLDGFSTDQYFPPGIKDQIGKLHNGDAVQRYPVYIQVPYDETTIESAVVTASALYAIGFNPVFVVPATSRYTPIML